MTSPAPDTEELLAQAAKGDQLAYQPRQQRQHTTFCLHFRPTPHSRLRSINVLPDFLGPDAVEIAGVEVDGVKLPVKDPHNFQVPLVAEDMGRNVCVRLRKTEAAHARLRGFAVKDDRLH
jgi:hypothetical protein